MLPRVFGSGKEALRKAAAVTYTTVATVGGSETGEGGAGKTPTRPARVRGGARDDRESKRRFSRGMAEAGEQGGGGRVENEDKEQYENEEEEEGQGGGGRRKRPPLLSVTVEGVSGVLPDVNWSVQMHHKRFLKIEDSGTVK